MSDAALALLEDELSHRERADHSRLPLLDFIPAVTPGRFRPEHLAPLAEALDRALAGEAIQLLVSVPPQHGKTETALHFIAKWLRLRPDHTLAYATYSQEQALDKSDLAQQYARAAGVRVRRDRRSLRTWRTEQGGGLIATGVGGKLSGNACRAVILDDPYRNARDANSGAYRLFVEEWLRGVAGTRGTAGLSIIVIHTRWHPEDIIGTLAKEDGWTVVNLPAVADERGAPADDVMTGTPLFALRKTSRGDEIGFSREMLARRRALLGEYLWWALYMGAPRPRGGSVFRGAPPRYDGDPRAVAEGHRIVLALDGAGSASEGANKSAICALAVSDARPLPTAWVLEVDSWKLEPQDSAARVAAFVRRWGGGELLIEDTRDGKAIGKVLRELAPSLSITFVVPVGDKFMRAQLLAAAWNQGRVMLPFQAGWLDEVLRVFGLFRGIGDEEDDEVDALSHAFNHALSQASQGVQFFDR